MQRPSETGARSSPGPCIVPAKVRCPFRMSPVPPCKLRCVCNLHYASERCTANSRQACGHIAVSWHAGIMAPVRELLASTSAELQSQLLGSMLRSDRKILARLAADMDCLRAMDLWMIDLVPDTRAFQILEDILQVRKSMSNS